jgi:phage N-6-adenine-methyltransferase
MTRVSKTKLGYVGSTPGNKKRDGDSWFTPSIYVESARYVMNGIDLDPFSSADAQRVVKAKRYFTKNSDAFKMTWPKTGHRTIWMNPPYSAFLCRRAIDKLIEVWKTDCFKHAVVLTNNATETRWFQQLLIESAAVCLPSKRIQFENSDGKPSDGGNTRGQCFFYLGRAVNRFANEFRKYGTVCVVKG